MPRRRLSNELWREKRLRVLARDGWRCVRCRTVVAEDTAHIDHIQSGKLGTNTLGNLRTLCRRCHVLRADKRHRGMTAGALRDEVIPANWRERVWDE